MKMDAQTLVIIAAIGIVAGFLASLLVGGGGLIQYLISGILGSFVGGYLLNALGVDPFREVRDGFTRMVPLSTGQVKPVLFGD